MTDASLETLKIAYIAIAFLLLALAQFLCQGCSMETRGAYFLMYVYGNSLAWSCFFSGKVFVGWYPVDTSNKPALYLALVVGLFLVFYSLYLLLVG